MMIFHPFRSAFLDAGAGQEHMQDRGHAVGKGHVFFGIQFQKKIGFVAAGVDLFGPQQGHGIGNPPGMNVEHRSDGHVDVFGTQVGLRFIGAVVCDDGVGVQHQLPVGEIDPLGQTGRAGGVKSGGHAVFIEIGKSIGSARPGQKGFILPLDGQAGIDHGAIVGQQDDLFGRFEPVFDRFQQRQELFVDQNHIVFSVIDRVDQLLGGKPDVDRMKNRTHHGDGKETFEITMSVPIHHGHRLPRFNADAGQCVGQHSHPSAEIAVGIAYLVAINDFLIR
jgi:hypothetical protein